MFRKRILCLSLALSSVLALGATAWAAEVDCDTVYCFGTGDFSSDAQLRGVCITGLPEPSAGTVLLGARVIRTGDILSADQLEMLTFQPLMTETDLQAQVTYLPIYDDRVEQATQMTISIKGKVDKAPVAEDSAIETYKNLPNEGKLKVTDPEGGKLTFTVTRQPKRGTVTIREDGTYLYTPKKNKVGTDSFTYTATDAAGKVSREATVTVEILKPSATGTYADTQGYDCRFEAEWLRNTGLFVGEQLDGKLCFQPEKTVSRGEFLTMLVRVLDIPVDDDAQYTGFADNCPGWLKPYLAAALRTGISAGWPYGEKFGAGEQMNGAEAALLLQNALDLTVDVDLVTGGDEDDEPTWAQIAITTANANGFALDESPMTRAQAAKLLYQVAKSAD